MGATLFIVPINPSDWQNSTTDFRVDPEELRIALQHNWPDTQFEPTRPEAKDELRWRFSHKGAIGGLLWLYSDGQYISLRPDIYCEEFILWFRGFVPEEQPLFLVFSPYHESYYLELTQNTSDEDIERYMKGSAS